MTAKIGKYAVDKLFHEISHNNNATTLHFMYFPNYKIEKTQVLNGMPCILYGEILINLNDLITISGIDRDTIGIRDKDKHTFNDPNELHNQEAMGGMFKGIGLTSLDLYQDSQGTLKNKRWNFD